MLDSVWLCKVEGREKTRRPATTDIFFPSIFAKNAFENDEKVFLKNYLLIWLLFFPKKMQKDFTICLEKVIFWKQIPLLHNLHQICDL